MGVREWVADVRNTPTQRPTEEPRSPRRSASPATRIEEVLARGNPWGHYTTPTAPTAPVAPKRTAGEWVSWLDQLNQPSTSNLYAQDPPLHQQPTAHRGMAAGAPGESPSSSSSSSMPTVRFL